MFGICNAQCFCHPLHPARKNSMRKMEDSHLVLIVGSCWKTKQMCQLKLPGLGLQASLWTSLYFELV